MMTKSITALLGVGALLTAAWVCADDAKIHAKKGEPEPPKQCVAVLAATEGNQIKGTILLTAEGQNTHVTGHVSGLTPGKHGFHIHEFGDLRSGDGESAGGHFNPENVLHAGPHDAEHHAGDLGNIEADDKGNAEVDMNAKGLMLHFAIGRAIVVHAKPDDLKSQPSGNAGPRVAVGVIGIANPKAAAASKTASKAKSSR